MAADKTPESVCADPPCDVFVLHGPNFAPTTMAWSLADHLSVECDQKRVSCVCGQVAYEKESSDEGENFSYVGRIFEPPDMVLEGGRRKGSDLETKVEEKMKEGKVLVVFLSWDLITAGGLSLINEFVGKAFCSKKQIVVASQHGFSCVRQKLPAPLRFLLSDCQWFPAFFSPDTCAEYTERIAVHILADLAERIAGKPARQRVRASSASQRSASTGTSRNGQARGTIQNDTADMKANGSECLVISNSYCSLPPARSSSELDIHTISSTTLGTLERESHVIPTSESFSEQPCPSIGSVGEQISRTSLHDGKGPEMHHVQPHGSYSAGSRSHRSLSQVEAVTVKDSSAPSSARRTRSPIMESSVDVPHVLAKVDLPGAISSPKQELRHADSLLGDCSQSIHSAQKVHNVPRDMYDFWSDCVGASTEVPLREFFDAMLISYQIELKQISDDATEIDGWFLHLLCRGLRLTSAAPQWDGMITYSRYCNFMEKFCPMPKESSLQPPLVFNTCTQTVSPSNLQYDRWWTAVCRAVNMLHWSCTSH